MRATRRFFHKAAYWATAGICLIWTLFPFYWALLASIKPERLSFTPVFLPFLQFGPTLEHWRWEWANRWDVEGLGTAWRGTTVVAAGTALACTSVGLLTAVGLLRLRRRRLPTAPLFLLFLFPRVMPPVALVTPVMLLLQEARLGDTYVGLIGIHTVFALPLAIFLLDSAVREVPRELYEAAQLEGASWGRILVQIVTPLVAPVLVAAGAISFAFSWDEFMFALLLHGNRVTTATVAVALMDRKDGVDFSHIGSHLVLVILPPALLTLAAQRYMVRGLALGAVQG